MDTIGSLVHGLAVALTPGNLLAVLVGSIIGTVIGVLPGLGPTASIALLLPVTIGMDMVVTQQVFTRMISLPSISLDTA